MPQPPDRARQRHPRIGGSVASRRHNPRHRARWCRRDGPRGAFPKSPSPDRERSSGRALTRRRRRKRHRPAASGRRQCESSHARRRPACAPLPKNLRTDRRRSPRRVPRLQGSSASARRYHSQCRANAGAAAPPATQQSRARPAGSSGQCRVRMRHLPPRYRANLAALPCRLSAIHLRAKHQRRPTAPTPASPSPIPLASADTSARPSVAAAYGSTGCTATLSRARD